MKSPPSPSTNQTPNSLLYMGQQTMSSMSAPLFASTPTPTMMWRTEMLSERDATRHRQFLVHVIQEALDLIDESGICDDDFEQSRTRR